MGTVAAIFSGIVAVARAIPVVGDWLDRFVAWYVARQIAAMKEENREAIKKAFEEYDQRELEKALGNPNAGSPSGIPGTVIIDSLPGVPRSEL